MILPSDSDLPPDRNDGDEPSEEPDDAINWWEAGDDDEQDPDLAGLPDELDDVPDELDDPNAPQLQSVAGPGWRNDLYKDLIESLRDLEAIEDPDDEFSPPEPPDLYTFFGELAAIRQEFRHDGQRTHETLTKLATFLPSAPGSGAPVRRSGKSGSSPEAWPLETCLALVSTWDLLPQATAAGAFESSLNPLLQAAGLTRVPTVGQPFDPATMTLAGTEPGPKKSPSGKVLREISAGFLRAGVLLRPASVIVSA
jgi:hypothetical protein